MFVYKRGQFYSNLKISKKYGFVLFQHSTENGDFYNKDEIINLMKAKHFSKVILIPYSDFFKHNKESIDIIPTDILIIGYGICEVLDLNSKPSLRDIITGNHLINEHIENFKSKNVKLSTLQNESSISLYDVSKDFTLLTIKIKSKKGKSFNVWENGKKIETKKKDIIGNSNSSKANFLVNFNLIVEF